MDLEDFIVSNNLLPLGSLVYLLFCVSRKGWGWDNFLAEANTGSGLKFPQGGALLCDLHPAHHHAHHLCLWLQRQVQDLGQSDGSVGRLKNLRSGILKRQGAGFFCLSGPDVIHSFQTDFSFLG